MPVPLLYFCRFDGDIDSLKLHHDMGAQLKLTEQKRDIHQAHGDQWAKRIRETRQLLENNPSYGVLAFDFQKNLPLPLTNVGAEYYKRQLWLHNFDINDLRTNQATMFLYSEHFACKGANDVISCLNKYLANYVSSDTKHLILFADNSFGQNKNR